MGFHVVVTGILKMIADGMGGECGDGEVLVLSGLVYGKAVAPFR